MNKFYWIASQSELEEYESEILEHRYYATYKQVTKFTKTKIETKIETKTECFIFDTPQQLFNLLNKNDPRPTLKIGVISSLWLFGDFLPQTDQSFCENSTNLYSGFIYEGLDLVYLIARLSDEYGKTKEL